MAGLTARDWPRSVVVAAGLTSFAIVCGLLYWAQVVLIPIALAALLTFVLTPLVNRLERFGVPRIPAVVLVVVLVATLFSGLGYMVGRQVSQFASDLPAHAENIKTKISDVRRMFKGGVVEKVKTTVQKVESRLKQEDLDAGNEIDPAARPAEKIPRLKGRDGTAGENEKLKAEEEPVPVQIQPESSALAVSNPERLAPLMEVLGTAGLVVVLVIFMLVSRDDLQSRLVSIAGQSSLAITTKALDDAAHRISRYLLMQFIINGIYGLALGCGLFLIGVPYAALWGLFGAAMRYLPYVGPWIAAILPITVSLITSTGWTQVLIVIGLFIVLELVVNNALEPWLYGHSVGLSAIAVIIAAIFWTWLWGPVGLVLSTPITVCLVVLGKYIPALSILDRLLGERPALKAHHLFYQRLLARDEDEAAELAEEHAANSPLESTCDQLLLPTLSLVQRDRARGHISENDEAFVLRAVEEIANDVAETEGSKQQPDERPAGETRRRRVVVIGYPARDRADRLALEMLADLLDPAQCDFEILSTDHLISENLARIDERDPACICLTSVPPGDLVQMRQLCKRLSRREPRRKIIAARLGARGFSDKSRELLISAGADNTVSTLAELRQALLPIIQFHRHAETADRHQPVAACAMPAGNGTPF